MFAGLPGIGVGTLFYVLLGLAMPVLELIRLARGTSSVARWRFILRQLLFSVSIVASIMLAERVLFWLLAEAAPNSSNPARMLNRELGTRAPESLLAAPVTAALLLLAIVLIAVEVLRVVSALREARRAAPGPGPSTDVFTPFPPVPPAPRTTSRRRVSTVEHDHTGAIAVD